MHSQRIVVTGGAGYIGSHFCKYAKSKGHKIFTIDNLSTGYKEFVKWGDFFLIDVRDSKAIKDSILYLYRNASIANKLGKNARKNVLKNFEVNKVNDQTLKVYSELIYSKNKK